MSCHVRTKREEPSREREQHMQKPKGRKDLGLFGKCQQPRMRRVPGQERLA